MFDLHKRSLLFVFAASAALSSYGQQKGPVPNGWHLMDQATSGYYGISLDKAYNFVKGRSSKTVIVAVIDSGIDTTHEDLKQVLWTNPGEVPGNGIDDDKNGYIDDVHGWNFIGGKDGRNVKEDSYEGARVYHNLKARFENVDPSTLNKEDKELYATWLRAKESVSAGGIDAGQLMMMKQMMPNLFEGDSLIRIGLNKQEYNGTELKAYTPTNQKAVLTKSIFLSIAEANKDYNITNQQILEGMQGELRKAEAASQAPKDYRGEIVGDNEADINDRYYGNNDIMANTPFHGTHVSGIIGAKRGNGKGIDGIADNVRIMTIRAVPDGDEHDKDIALGIRYAVDNGAKIINMSFGKGFSPQKHWVDDAVRYAESKGVLLIHAAGNDGSNLDSAFNFPNPEFKNDGKRARTWLTIGASANGKANDLAADFSNYGKKEVDVFSPGAAIYSTIPGGNTYGNASGTSMASPVVAGTAAFLLSYYPTLTAAQLKMILENSSIKSTVKTSRPGAEEEDEKIPFSTLSRTGGVINAYEAARMAQQITSGKTVPAKATTQKSKTKIKTDGKETKIKTDGKETKIKIEEKTKKVEEKKREF